MPPASFKDEETRIAFYEKYNKQKELGTGRFSQINIEKKAQRRAQRKAEKKAEVVVAV